MDLQFKGPESISVGKENIGKVNSIPHTNDSKTGARVVLAKLSNGAIITPSLPHPIVEVRCATASAARKISTPNCGKDFIGLPGNRKRCTRRDLSRPGRGMLPTIRTYSDRGLHKFIMGKPVFRNLNLPQENAKAKGKEDGTKVGMVIIKTLFRPKATTFAVLSKPIIGIHTMSSIYLQSLQPHLQAPTLR